MYDTWTVFPKNMNMVQILQYNTLHLEKEWICFIALKSYQEHHNTAFLLSEMCKNIRLEALQSCLRVCKPCISCSSRHKSIYHQKLYCQILTVFLMFFKEISKQMQIKIRKSGRGVNHWSLREVGALASRGNFNGGFKPKTELEILVSLRPAWFFWQTLSLCT